MVHVKIFLNKKGFHKIKKLKFVNYIQEYEKLFEVFHLNNKI